MSHRIARSVLVAVALTACGPRPWWTASQVHPTHPGAAPYDSREIYRSMGYLVDTAQLRFVGSLRYLAAPTPDSTIVVFGLSLSNRALSFRTQGSDFVGRYHVDISFSGDSGYARDVSRDETVKVHSVVETQRTDESIIYQENIPIRPGIYGVSVVVRDLQSPAHGSHEIRDTVPRFDGPSLGTPIPIYQGHGRASLADFPDLVINPRGTVLTGPDSLHFYIEGYHLPPGTKLAAWVMDRDSVPFWQDTVTLEPRDRNGTLQTAKVAIGPGVLPLGSDVLWLSAIGSDSDIAVGYTPFLVSFSDRWAVASWDQMLSLFKFFDRQDLVTELRNASKADRIDAWRQFNRSSDTVPTTRQNEALDGYLQRLETANRRFQEFVDAGWLTDRGEVYITLGEPDRASEVPGKMGGAVKWEYDHPHVTLYFEDQSGLGQYKLTPESREDYQTALNSLRRTSGATGSRETGDGK